MVNSLVCVSTSLLFKYFATLFWNCFCTFLFTCLLISNCMCFVCQYLCLLLQVLYCFLSVCSTTIVYSFFIQGTRIKCWILLIDVYRKYSTRVQVIISRYLLFLYFSFLVEDYLHWQLWIFYYKDKASVWTWTSVHRRL